MLYYPYYFSHTLCISSVQKFTCVIFLLLACYLVHLSFFYMALWLHQLGVDGSHVVSTLCDCTFLKYEL